MTRRTLTTPDIKPLEPLTLPNLRELRLARDITAPALCAMTGLTANRLLAIETKTDRKRVEPWLDEAYRIANVLGLGGIIPLMSSGDLTSLDLGEDQHDRDALRAGARLPLSTAVRLTIALGFDDPIELVVEARHAQLWDLVERNERGAARGQCPCCLADIQSGEFHRDTCAPAALWSRRQMRQADLKVHPRPRKRVGRAASGLGHGLRPLRELHELTQAEFAEKVGMGANHYSRVERCDLNLTLDAAKKISDIMRVDIAVLYRKTEEDAANQPAHDTTDTPTVPGADTPTVPGADA
jgi:transcriptional regulator with XRE-family HTH domain